MRKVILEGELGEKFGSVFEFHVKTVRQALSLLSANFPDFKQHIVDSDTRLAGYTVYDGDRDIDATEADFTKQGTGDIRIVPVLRGSSSTARIIIGAIMVVVGAYSWYTPWGPSLVIGGIGMIAGGVYEKLSPKPKTPQVEEVNSSTSYMFSSHQNNTRQGMPICVTYGTFLGGSNVGSQSITASDIPA